MTTAASISLIGNMSSRLLTGMAVDRFGFKATTLAIAIACIVFGISYDSVGHIPICFAIWLFVSQVLFAGNMVACSIVAIRLFGPEIGAQVYPFIHGGITTSICILTFFVLYLQNIIGYNGMHYLLSALEIVSMLIILTLKDERIQYSLKACKENLIKMEEDDEK